MTSSPTDQQVDDAARVLAAFLQIRTPWDPEHGFEHLQDGTRHERFAEMAALAVRGRFPWLPALLHAAGAKVLACPGHFLVEAPAGSGMWVEVLEVSDDLRLLPWREEHEDVQ